jgi:hypothetical protein
MKLKVLLQTATLLSVFYYPQITSADNLPDVDKDLMYFIEETNDKLNSDLALKLKAESIEGADMMIELTQMVEEHFTAWAKNQKATQLAKTSLQTAINIAELVRADEFEAAAEKGIELSNNCESCHQLF